MGIKIEGSPSFKERIIRLIDVKSIVTFIFVISFIIFVVKGYIGYDKFSEMFLFVLTFYFGVQTGKNDNKWGAIMYEWI